MVRGRHATHFRTAAGQSIEGLIRQRDGRYRILATGKRFVAASEAEAVATYRRLTLQPEKVNVPSQANLELHGYCLSMRSEMTGNAFWPWLRELLTTRMQEVADKTGLPGLASLDLQTLPTPSAKLSAIRDLYVEKSESNWRTREQGKAAFTRLKEITGAETLGDLTTEVLIKFREKEIGQLAPTGTGAVFGKIKSALAFAAKYGMDPQAIAEILNRAKVLSAPRSNGHSQPTPMSPKDFRKLLAAADVQWRVKLLLALKLALYTDDICIMN